MTEDNSGTSPRQVVAPGTDLGGYWLIGVVIAIIGVILMANSVDAGIAVLAVGGIVLQLAVIATGVSLGMRHRDHWNRTNGL